MKNEQGQLRAVTEAPSSLLHSSFFIHHSSFVIVFCLMLSGCRPAEPEKAKPAAPPPIVQPSDEGALRPRARRGQQKVEKIEEAPAPAAAPGAIPKVVLSDELKATNRVQVGDKLPDGELPDLSGKAQSIAKLQGRKATVLFFATPTSNYFQTELEDLQADVCQPLAEKGVQVIGVVLDKDAARVRQVADKAGVKFPILLDPEKKYFAKLATDKPLRTYLVDGQGVIRWFDIEYSRSTERELLASVQFLLGPEEKK
jgi:peroxiredoxin